MTRFGIAAIGTKTRRSVAYSASSRPSPACTRVVIGGSIMRQLLVIRQVAPEIPDRQPDKAAAGDRQQDRADKQEPNELDHHARRSRRAPSLQASRQTTVASPARRRRYAPSARGYSKACFARCARSGAARAVRHGRSAPAETGEETIVAPALARYIEDREIRRSPTGRRARRRCDAQPASSASRCRRAGSQRRAMQIVRTRSRACLPTRRRSTEFRDADGPKSSRRSRDSFLPHRPRRRPAVSQRPRPRAWEFCPNGKTHAHRCHPPRGDPGGRAQRQSSRRIRFRIVHQEDR